jgi:phosphoribosyl 1,2-cyclic phosphate phosphodiesterase
VTSRYRATILGCGASPGVPRIGNDWGACDPSNPRNRRTRTSLLVERVGGGQRPTRVLIDTGPDMRAQLLATNVDAIDGVVYTHAHADHTHGIDDLRAFAQNTGHLVSIFADDMTADHLERTFAYCFRTPTSSLYPPILRMHRLTIGVPFTITGPGGELTLLPLRQIHGDTDSLCLRIGGLAYSCDVSDVPAETQPVLAGIDLWIVDGLRDRPHPSHFTVGQALGWIDRLKAKRAVLTHMTNDLDYAELRGRLPAHVEPAYDGMTVEFDGNPMASADPGPAEHVP